MYPLSQHFDVATAVIGIQHESSDLKHLDFLRVLECMNFLDTCLPLRWKVPQIQKKVSKSVVSLQLLIVLSFL
jgi:hypothetical protein